MIRKLYYGLLWVQGGYTLLTALWGLLHIESFLLVTGPKTDVWLVKTVSVILVAVALALIAGALTPGFSLPLLLLGLGTSAGLAAIDFHYAGRDTISDVYLLDGIAESLLALGWLVVLSGRTHVDRARHLQQVK